MYIRRLILLFLLLNGIIDSFAANVSPSDEMPPTDSNTLIKRRMLFVQSGFQLGIPFFYEKLPEGKYVPVLLQGNLDFQFKKLSASNTKNHRFYFYLEPTANPVMIPDTTSSIELGGLIGLKYGYYFNTYNSIKLHISSGPQYQHFVSANQANGIIFSDNFGISYQRDVKHKPLYLSFGYRFRHTSNLNINLPNGGIDTHFFLLGIGRNRHPH